MKSPIAFSTRPSRLARPILATALAPTLASVLAGVLALGLARPEAAHAQGLGVAAGLNFNDLNDIQTESTDATFENATGYHLGVFFELGAGSFVLRPGLFYHQLGTYDFPTGEEFDLSAIEVPIDLRLTVVPTGLIGVYVLAGPVLTFPQGDDEFETAVEDISLTADVGAGVSIALGSLVLMPELRYSIGVTDYLSDDFQVGGVTIQPEDDNQRLSKIMLRLNVMF